ncbi:WW domain-containing oxidoreductase, partial [Brachionus plicatilis]
MSQIDSILNVIDDDLPEGWEERVTPYGKVYYANHVTRSTQWEHPVTGEQKILSGELPYGWERKVQEDGTIVFVDQINNVSSYTDPRLAFARNENQMKTFYFDENSTALDLIKNRDLSGKFAIVVGANRGVGYEITRALAFQGCYVIMACRNTVLGQTAYDHLCQERNDIILEVMELKLESLMSVKEFCDKIVSRNIPVNMLILNAAILEINYQLSENNLELMFQVNYLAQFYLSRLLLQKLINIDDARIVVLSCESHRGGNLSRTDISAPSLNVTKSEFNFLQVFCNTKLCNLLFANELNRRINKTKNLTLSCKACHPGNLLPTKLYWNWTPYRILNLFTNKFSKTSEQAAAIPVLLATVERDYFQKKENFYWNSLTECNPSDEANDSVLAYRLWEISESILIKNTSSFDDFL